MDQSSQQRKQWHGLIQSGTVADVVPSSGRKIVSIAADDTIMNAFRLLREHRFMALPVHKGETWIGWVDMLDVMTMLWVLAQAKGLADALSEDNVSWESYEHQELVTLKKTCISDVINASGRNRWCPVTMETPLTDVMSKVSTEECDGSGDDTTVTCRRVPVMRGNDLIAIITCTDLARWLVDQVAKVPLLGAVPLVELRQERKAAAGPAGGVISVCESDPIINALNAFVENCVSAVAVVKTEGGAMVGVFSASDIKRSPAGQLLFSELRMSCATYLERTQASASPFVGDVFVASPHDSLKQALDTCLSHKLHRLFVVDDDGKPVNVYTLGDMIGMCLDLSRVDQAA